MRSTHQIVTGFEITSVTRPLVLGLPLKCDGKFSRAV